MRIHFALLSLALYAGSVQAQPGTFSSGSTGADGALTYAPSLGTVYFPPAGLAARANNIYNFTTITIGTGTTVRVSGWVINGPVYWLAQSDVTISGVLDISGQPGNPANNASARAPSEPGAGGYSGGVGQLLTGQNAAPGNGPGGGPAPGWNTSAPDDGGGGTYTGSSYLQPLTGGSGGGGGCRPSVTSGGCGGGGAGGGAILIASSTKISGAGAILATGGRGATSYGGGGTGGAIRLVSNAITESAPAINICGGLADQAASFASGGIVRYEAFSVSLSSNPLQGCGNGGQGTLYISIPYNLALPAGGPSLVNVTSVNGVTINANPFTFPDAIVNTGSPVPVVISGTNVPPGTKGNLYIYSESTPDQTIPFTLAGTLQSTAATVSITYPPGGSRGFAKATWTTP